MSAPLAAGAVQIEQQTRYPWDGEVNLTLHLNQPQSFRLALRIPDWCANYSIRVNSKTADANVQRGYALLDRLWSSGDTVELNLSMPVERIVSHPNVRHNAGCVALQRGPIVYALEEADNGGNLANLIIPRGSRLAASIDESLFNGVSVVTGEAIRAEPARWQNGLYQPQSALQYDSNPVAFKAIPYSLWANRQPGEMRVWMRDQ
jgi:DUF1680 family protein